MADGFDPDTAVATAIAVTTVLLESRGYTDDVWELLKDLSAAEAQVVVASACSLLAEVMLATFDEGRPASLLADLGLRLARRPFRA